MLTQGVCANYSTLYRLARKGIMLIDASMVEPLYSGFLSCFILNLSSKPIAIKQNEPIAKITFMKVEGEILNPTQLTIADDDYKHTLIDYAIQFDSSFLNLESIKAESKKEATKSVRGSITFAGIVIALLLLWSSLDGIISKKLFENNTYFRMSEKIENTVLTEKLYKYYTGFNDLEDEEKQQKLSEIISLLDTISDDEK